MEEIVSQGKLKHFGACMASVEYRTTGYCGGDAGHGGFLEITFKNEGGASIDVSIDDLYTGIRLSKNVDKVTLKFAGDSEIGAAVRFLHFLSASLKQMRE